MKSIRYTKMLAVLCGCSLMLTACGKQDEALAAYQEDMNTFFEQVAACNDGMNAIDASSPDAQTQLLSYLDQLQSEMTWMAGLEVPDQFSAVDSLADEADENMQQAVSLYHQAFAAEPFDENIAEAADEYYSRANIRVQYIITILHGEIPDGEGVTYTESSGILGEGYLNKDNTEEETPDEAGTTEEIPEDNFDTDDTVFYEE